MSAITVKDGTKIYYKDWGKGPVITFSHVQTGARHAHAADPDPSTPAPPRSLFFAALAQPRRLRQSQKLDASRSSLKGEQEREPFRPWPSGDHRSGLCLNDPNSPV
jgi:hypothetical protein